MVPGKAHEKIRSDSRVQNNSEVDHFQKDCQVYWNHLSSNVHSNSQEEV